MAGGYSGVTINSAKPIEGSVNVSVNEDSSTELRYEGGEVAAGSESSVKVTMEWKVPGSATAGKTTNTSATLSAGSSGEIGYGTITVYGTLLTSPGWDPNWGCVTTYKIEGTTTAPTQKT